MKRNTTNVSAPKTSSSKKAQPDTTSAEGQKAFVLDTLAKAPAPTKTQGKAKPAAAKPTVGEAAKVIEQKAKAKKESRLCLTGSGKECKGDFAGLGMDARYKSRLLDLATNVTPDDLPTGEQLKKLGYTDERIKLIPRKGMTASDAAKVIADRNWTHFLTKRKAKLEEKAKPKANGKK